jgi:flagellar motor switch protein FliG
MVTASKLRGGQKAAVLVIALGQDIAAKIYPFLSEEEIEDITMELANIGKIENEEIDSVLNEFYEIGVAQRFISTGGVEYAKSVLSKAMGDEKAEDILNRLSTFLQVKPFDLIRKTDASSLINFIHNEHPQTIALILSYLDSSKGAQVVQALEPEKQVDVVKRMALMDQTSPEVIREIERVLEKNLSTLISQEFSQAGGVPALVDILNRVDRATEKAILEKLEEDDPELAEEIKNRMFIFEDIVHLNDRAIQQVLKEVDTKELSLALKGVSEEVLNKITKNLSKRAGAMLVEDMEFMGPVRLKDVEASQQRIVNVIRSLEEAGEIVIVRGGEDELVS